MTESIMSSVEGQCELEIKRAVSLDIYNQHQNNQSKIKSIKSFFVSITDFFIIITEKSKCIGQLFIPSYTGYEKFQDNVRFNFYFRVRDSVGYDVSLKPPERLRKRFESKLHSIWKMIANLGQSTQDNENKSFECLIEIDKSTEKIVVHIEDHFINISRAESGIFLDKIDLSEPNVYVDGFIGFDKPSDNLSDKYSVFIYADNQLRQTLIFEKKQVTESQDFMKTVATRCAQYCDDSDNPLFKGLEIKNSESQIDNIEEISNISSNKKSSSIGINEFREEPKYTKFPQTAKQKMKKNIKKQIKVHKSLFEQSKKDLKDLRADQKRIQTQLELRHPEEKKKEKEEEIQNDQKFQQQKPPLPQIMGSSKQVSDIPDSDDEDDEKIENIQRPRSNTVSKPSRIPLGLSSSKNYRSQLNIKMQKSLDCPYPDSILNPNQISQDNINFNQNAMYKSKSQSNYLQNEETNSPQLQKKKLYPFLNQSPAKELQDNKKELLFEPQEEEKEIRPKKLNPMKMEEKDINELRIITKSYLMIDFRKEYFKNGNYVGWWDKETNKNKNNNDNNNNKKKDGLLPQNKPIKYKFKFPDIKSYDDKSLEKKYKDMLKDLSTSNFPNLVNKMMKEKTDIDAVFLIQYINKYMYPELQNIPFDTNNYSNEEGNVALAKYFESCHTNNKLCTVFNAIYAFF